MATPQEHYSTLLSELYSWMLGGFGAALPRNREFLRRHRLAPRGSAHAIDAGAGCGFQSIPLAEAGYSVRAIDTDAGLLRELEARANGLPIVTVHDDLKNLHAHAEPGSVELVICLTDTILLLESVDGVCRFFAAAYDVLEAGGRLVVTFRDLSEPLYGLDRFIPVRADGHAVFTCFLEYEADTVKVHDIVHIRRGDHWEFRKSVYRKLRLSGQSAVDALSAAGFARIDHGIEAGMVTLVAGK